MMQATEQPLGDECWIVTNGVIGRENQCLGLAERLGLALRKFRITLTAPWQFLAPYSFGRALAHLAQSSDTLAPPWPRILIGCGRHSIPISLAVKRASGGRTIIVQCEHPRVPARWFDLVVAPMHDGLTGPNVVTLLGSPNRVTPARLDAARAEFAPVFSALAAPRIAVLIGGESRTHGSVSAIAADALVSAIARLASHYGLMISTSRRTPAAVTAKLQASLLGKRAFLWDGSGPNPYFGMLAWADAFLVTADSVNMICDAATTGKPVHVFPVSGGRRRSRIFHRQLQERGITRPFLGKIEEWHYPMLDETGRAAGRIQSLLENVGFSSASRSQTRQSIGTATGSMPPL